MPGMRRAVFTLLALSLIVGAACAPKTTAPVLPTSTAARFPEFVKPTIADDVRASEAGRNVDAAWAYLQAGDLRTAERLASSKLGVVAFSSSGDPETGDYDDEPTVLFRSGQIPSAFD